jgi:uncharacterized membrane protein YfcA
VPWLILGASALLALQDPLRRWLQKHRQAGDSRLGAALPIALASVYGGYFGAGLGVVMLATLGVTLDDSINRLNAVKQALAFVINMAAALFFLTSDQVNWPVVGVMSIAALLGGTLGGRLARVIPASRLRLLVVLIGTGVGLFYLLS